MKVDISDLSPHGVVPPRTVKMSTSSISAGNAGLALIAELLLKEAQGNERPPAVVAQPVG